MTHPRTFPTCLLVMGLLGPVATAAGPYPPAAGQPGSDALAANDPRFSLWAVEIEVERGPVDRSWPDSIEASYGDPAQALGPADASPDEPWPVVSLGDGGSATLRFDPPFGDLPGPDFAVFENAFGGAFLELAHVEVSSDGVRFFRFPSVSLTAAPIGEDGSGGAVDPRDVHNLAGKYTAGFGTPFDLAELRHHSPLLDIQRITHVRVIDVVGSSDPAYGSTDSRGNLIIDPFPTPWFSSGFDLDAVGAFQATSTQYGAWAASQDLAEADPDQPAPASQGLPPRIAYLTGGAGLALLPAAPAGALRLEYPRLAYRGDATLRLEASADLRSWQTLVHSTGGHPAVATALATSHGCALEETGETLRQVSLQVPPASPWRFFRLAADP
jgi:hypothetical protein